MAQTTKRALGASLKKLLAEKPLDKITVGDITQDCEVNRQTFYYHFKDVCDLIEWVYLDEATHALDGRKTYDTWQEGFYAIFQWVLANRAFVLGTYHSLSREHLERYLYGETRGCCSASWRSRPPAAMCAPRTGRSSRTCTNTPSWGWYWIGSAPA